MPQRFTSVTEKTAYGYNEEIKFLLTNATDDSLSFLGCFSASLERATSQDWQPAPVCDGMPAEWLPVKIIVPPRSDIAAFRRHYWLDQLSGELQPGEYRASIELTLHRTDQTITLTTPTFWLLER